MQPTEGPSIRCYHCGKWLRLDEAHVHQLAQPLLEAREAEIRQQADAAALASYEGVLNDGRARIGELETTVREQRTREANLLRAQRKLQDDKAALEVEKERDRRDIRMQERTDAHSHFAQLFSEKELRKDAAHAEEIAVLNRTHDLQLERVKFDAEALKRKADSGSRQAEGIARQDLYGEEMRRRFPGDKIAVTVPGKWGWDVTHDVRLGNLGCGTIAHECKRTQKWNPQWVRKLGAQVREDPDVKFGVIVTQALPPGTTGSSQIDGIWVTDFAHAGDLIPVVREMVIMMHAYETTGAAEADIAGRLHHYVYHGGFAARIKVIEQALDRLDADLEQEKRLTPLRWKRRETDHAEIRKAGLEGILLDIIGLGGEIPPGARGELEEGDTPELPPA